MMNNGLVFVTYIERTIALIVSCYCIKGIFSKKSTLDPQKALNVGRKSAKKFNKKLDIMMRILMGLYVTIAIPLAVIPAILDIPYVIEKKYETMECKTISYSRGNNIVEKRDIQVVDLETQKRIKLAVVYTSIEKNEYYTINYLPHLKVGTIIQKVVKK